VDTLLVKCRRAMEQEGLSTLVMAGGVSANRNLRARLREVLGEARRAGFLPGAGILHRQRRDDCLRRRAAPGRRRAGRARYIGPPTLAHG
jgi:hypothetical protein